MRIAVVTDSTAYIPIDLREKHSIHMVPLSVVFDDSSYQEEVDITAKEFYQKIKATDRLPTTSQPSIGTFTQTYEKLAENYDAVFSIHLSSGISGTYQAAVSAGSMVEGIEVYPYDSELSAIGQGFLVLEAAEMARDNHKIPEEILERLNQMKQYMRAYFMVDDLTNLQRGGRLSSAQAMVGNLLKMKPVLHFVNTVIEPFEKIRTRKKALHRMLGMLEDDINAGHTVKVAIIHANGEQDAIDIKNDLKAKYPSLDCMISYFGPVIGTHLGEGAIGICWHRK